MNKPKASIGIVAAALAFLGSWCFFWFVYPAHIMRREQLTLFLFDGDYIRQTYRGAAWLARFVSDFLEQFFLFPVLGSFIVAALLTGIGVVVYRIARKFLGKWPSLAISTVFFAWSFLRETGNLYITRYTVVTLAYLGLALAVLALILPDTGGRSPRFSLSRNPVRIAAGVLLPVFGIWALGSPVHKDYGKPWGVPRIDYEQVIALDIEVSLEHWDKVVQLSRKDLHMVESSYCYNLANAMQGTLGQALFNYVQRPVKSLLMRVDTENSMFTNSLAGEAWFQLGDMTVAEQSAITSLQASPKLTGARFIVRLARVNLITGESASAQKYLNLLSRTLFYGRWARSMMPGREDEATRAELVRARARLAETDFVHQSDRPRQVLLGLLAADPANRPAREYLYCYDLMTYDLDAFMEDYAADMIPSHIYQEAILIWLSRNDLLTPEQVTRYGVALSEVDRMGRFGRNPGAFKNTYWYYYLKALNEQ